MMGTQAVPAQLFYDFCIEEHVPTDHLLRRIDQFLGLEDLRTRLKPYYSAIGRPSVDPELMIRMLIVGYSVNRRAKRTPLPRERYSAASVRGNRPDLHR